jgi:iron complex transport system ATP-binding protein
MLEVRDLSVKYGDRHILKNIDFSVRKGEFLGIVGPNGSGKTTLLKSILNYLKPASGSVHVNGMDVESLGSRELARIMAVVSQVISVSFEFSVEDIVMMGRTPYINGSEKQEDYEIAREAMKKTSTYEFRDRPVTQLSGGELQRVIIARAFAQSPMILLLDEPTSHLDIAHQIDILGLVKEASRNDMSVIAVIHDLNLAAYYCDRICLLKEGQIVAAGQPDTVLTPKNLHYAFNIQIDVSVSPTTRSLYIMPVLEPLGNTISTSHHKYLG